MPSSNLGDEAGPPEPALELPDRQPRAGPPEEPPAPLSDADRRFISWLRRRMVLAYCNHWLHWTRAKFHWADEAGGWVRTKIGLAETKGPWALLTFVLTVVVLIFGIHEYFHLKEPTLRATREQTAATMAQAAAAEWDNYQTWVMDVCPSELACQPGESLAESWLT